MKRLRKVLRRVLPEPLTVPLKRGDNYVRRLRFWAAIARDVRGVSAADRAALRRSLLAAPATCARGLDRWTDPLLLADAEVEVRGVGRFRLRARTDDLWHVAPAREVAVIGAIRERLKAGDTFVDAGANIGFYTVMAAHIVGPSGRVVAFEMMPDTAAVLRRHVELNGLANVTIVERALADVADETVEAHVEEGKFGQASISAGKPGRLISVRTTTLDEVLGETGEIAVLKMDIEGAEAPALRGADKTLERIGHVVFESWGENTVVDDLLTARGFALRDLGGLNRIASRS